MPRKRTLNLTSERNKRRRERAISAVAACDAVAVVVTSGYEDPDVVPGVAMSEVELVAESILKVEMEIKEEPDDDREGEEENQSCCFSAQTEFSALESAEWVQCPVKEIKKEPDVNGYTAEENWSCSNTCTNLCRGTRIYMSDTSEDNNSKQKKMKLTNAEKLREYRKRKKIESGKVTSPPKTPKERSAKHYAKLKLLAQQVQGELHRYESVVEVQCAAEDEEIEPPVTIFLQPKEEVEEEREEAMEDPLALCGESVHNAFGSDLKTKDDEELALSGEHGDADNPRNEMLPQLTPQPSTVSMKQHPWMCALCSNSYSSKLNLNKHMQTHQIEKQYGCNICPAKFSRNENLQHHIQLHVRETFFECFICKKRFVLKQNYDSHMQNHIIEEFFECIICKKRCLHKNHYFSHMVTHCTLCERIDTSSQRQKATVELPSESRIRSQRLSSPLPQVTPPSIRARMTIVQPSYTCAICNINYPSKSCMKAHVRSHPVKNGFRCTVCQRIYSWLEDAQYHIQLHTGERPYECTICQKNFTEEEYIMHHIEYHSH